VKKILVPLDGSKISEEALAPALGMAARHRATLELVHIVPELAPVPVAMPGPESFQDWIAKEEKRAVDYLEGLKTGLKAPGVEVPTHVHVRIGFVAESILELADDLGVDLIVLTSHGKGRWERFWIGSVADRLLRAAERPLLLLRPGAAKGFASGSPKRALVPLDGTPGAEAALDPLRELCAPESCHLELASVLSWPESLPGLDLADTLPDPIAAVELEKSLGAYLQGIKERLQAVGFREIDCRVVRRNDVGRCLLEIAASDGVDLIALATRGRRGLDRLVLGSVADKLIRGSETAVFAVPRNDRHG
jgi:nucleotide-binding universal stress UspA family protein